MGIGICLLLSVLGYPTVVSAADPAPRCDFCREEIHGRFVVYNGENRTLRVCESCDRTLPHCAICSRPFKGGATKIGESFVCRDCSRDALTCTVCSRLIQGSYTVYSQGTQEYAVCSECNARAVRCASCQRPLSGSDAVRSGNRVLCRDCKDTLPVCGACDQTIIGTQYMIRFQPREYCESCWKTRPVCSMCGVPCGLEMDRLSDGRLLCTRCGETAVVTVQMLQEILGKVQPFLEKELGKPMRHKIVLRLVGPEEIDQMAPGFRGRGGAPPPMEGASASGNDTPNRMIYRADFESGRGAAEKELGKFIRRGNTFEIRILSGQPQSWAWETIAHEFAHAWQSEYNPKLNDPVWEEGFAQWAAEVVLFHRGDTELLERLRLRSDFYGQAFRIVNHYEALRGKAGVLQALLTMKNDPSTLSSGENP